MTDPAATDQTGGPRPGLGLSGRIAERFQNTEITPLLALVGLLLGLFRHPRLTTLGLLWFACTWLFAVGYANAAIERYYLVPLLVAALAIGLAADAIWALVNRVSTALLEGPCKKENFK